MKRLPKLLTTLSLAIQLVYASVVFSQPAILLAPELKPFPRTGPLPPIPLPPKPKVLPNPFPFSTDHKEIRRAPFPIPPNEGFAVSFCDDYYCVLNARSFKQLEAGWCWNAAAQSVMRYHGYYFSQCTIANTTYPPPSSFTSPQPCCLQDGRPDPATNCRLIGSPSGLPQDVFNAFEFDYWPAIGQLATPSWSYAVDEILNYRPFIAWLDPRSSGLWAHTYVVHGFNKLNNAMELRLSDPQQGPSVINPQNPPWAEDWFQPWDNMLRVHSSGQLLPVGLGDTNNEHKGDITRIEPQ